MANSDKQSAGKTKQPDLGWTVETAFDAPFALPKLGQIAMLGSIFGASRTGDDHASTNIRGPAP